MNTHTHTHTAHAHADAPFCTISNWPETDLKKAVGRTMVCAMASSLERR